MLFILLHFNCKAKSPIAQDSRLATSSDKVPPTVCDSIEIASVSSHVDIFTLMSGDSIGSWVTPYPDR